MQKKFVKIHESIQLFKQSLQSVYPDSEIESLVPLMAEYVFRSSYFKITLNKEKTITQDEYNRLNYLMDELKSGKPIQYIMGYTYFLDLKLKVNEHVLIPRPETEELVMEFIKQHKDNQEPLEILDIGTGSGCIALAIKKNLPRAYVHAIDVSASALAVAKENAAINQLDIEFTVDNIMNPGEYLLDRTYDCIISNPPYIPDAEKSFMKPQVIDYEPHIALFVPDDSQFLFYKKIARLGKLILINGGSVLLELNEFHYMEICDIFLELGYNHINYLKDMQQKPRILTAQYGC
ncbi:MAG: peptide chain release factor N(5)-glutamine methyltransferase [Bacteroidetes bacterium]|jgi:release factor glutamine methyltransferase|nr:peptide chain release factor N(5)-glutamine methyltransferase [Bacteroidota bacterium]